MDDRQDQPLVSVVIPTFNRERVLQRAVNSALRQSYGNIEIIVVDDASTDGTPDLLRCLGDPRIMTITHGHNRGGSAARNTALSHSRGQFIAFLDSDDEWLPNKLEAQVEKFQKCSGKVGIVHTGAFYVDASGSPLPVRQATYRGDVFRDLLLANQCGSTSLNMIRREALAVAPGFDEALPAMQDHDFFLRISKVFHVENIDRSLAVIHEGIDDVRISMNRPGKLAAREIFLAKHRADLEREKLVHIYLRDTARLRQRLLGDMPGARRLYLQALAVRPSVSAAVRLLSTFLPVQAYRAVARLWQSLRRQHLRFVASRR